MKLIIQIPCFNEEATLPGTLADLPTTLPGIDQIEVLIIDDGSTDQTIEVARRLGVDHIIRNKRNMGLARTFQRGLDACLDAGADIVVNTDGDNQYVGADIAKLVAPILAGEADIVIGDRRPADNPEFSALKRRLQKLGSGVVTTLAGVNVPDSVSGFRAISRDAARQLNIVSGFSYTTEMVIQAGKRGIAMTSVPVRTNSKTRDSRLFTSLPGFIGRSATTMIRTYAMYKPLRVFFFTGLAVSLVGVWPLLRFLWFYAHGEGGGHIQSLVIGGALLTVGSVCFMIALIADLVAVNRQLLERVLYRVGRIENARGTTPVSPSRSGPAGLQRRSESECHFDP